MAARCTGPTLAQGTEIQASCADSEVETHLSASARPPSASAVVAELQSRHATEVRSYIQELCGGDATRAEAVLAVFWREWTPPPGSANEIPREYVFAGARRQAMVEQRRAGAAEREADEVESDEAKDASARVAGRFRRLTAKQQEVVRLHLLHRFSVDEIAEITELSPGGTAQLLHTACGRLNGSANEEARLAQLALSGASGEQLAGESSEDRARVAELRLTIEVTRQVLARGLEAYRTRPSSSRRGLGRWVFALGGAAVLLALGVWWWLQPAREDAAGGRFESEGSARVALRRTENVEEAHTSGVGETGSRGVAQGGVADTRRLKRSPSTRPVATEQKPPDATTQTHASTASSARQAEPITGVVTGAVAKGEPEARPEGATELTQNNEPSASAEGHREERRHADAVAREVAQATQPAAAPAEKIQDGVAPVPPVATTPGEIAASAAVRREPSVLRKMKSPTLKAGRVDTAPIAALRKALGASRWPAPQEVSVAALVDAFPPNPEPRASEEAPFTTRVESSEVPWKPGSQLVRVTLRAREDAPVARAPATVILLLDVSGSMDAPNRLPLVQEAVAGLLRRLRQEDRVGVVTYAGESRVLLPPAPLRDEQAVRRAVESLEAKGRTNGGAGLREAFALAESDGRAHGNHVVILCTDGDFNMGETTEEQLGALIDRHREAGVKLAIFGFGRAARIDARLEALAARARGGSGYVNTRAEAEQALVGQLDALFAPVATQLGATVEFDPSRVAKVRALDADEAVANADGLEFAVAQRERVLPGETVSALFEVELQPDAAMKGGAWRVRFSCDLPEQNGQAPYAGATEGELDGKKFEEASVDFRFAAAVSRFGEALRAGPQLGADRLDEIERWARAALGEDAGGYRAEFLRLIEQARRVSAKH